MGTNSPFYALARIDIVSASTHGWQVRLQRRGQKYAKFFSDSAAGSPERALYFAKQWRDQLVEKLEVDDSARICKRSLRNSSGVIGVSRVKVTTNGTVYEFWQATWSPRPGERRCLKFSIKRYGDERAFTLAVEARRKGINS